MKILHVADLHLGKRFYGMSLAEDQQVMLDQLLVLAARSDVDAVAVAGDLYDRPQPSPEAVRLVSSLMTRLAALGKPVLVVSGNHDHPDQVAYCAELLADRHIHVAERFRGSLQQVVLEDAEGSVCFTLMPYLKPATVRRYFPEAEIHSYADAVACVLAATPMAMGMRQVLVGHQFVAGGTWCEQDEHMVGGLEQIPASVFQAFDAVLMGHLHRPQKLDNVLYAGSPLAYAFDEAGGTKSVSLVTVARSGLSVERIPIRPLRAVRTVRGSLEALCAAERTEDWICAELTGRELPVNAQAALLPTYPNLAHLRFPQVSEQHWGDEAFAAEAVVQDPVTLFTRFYEQTHDAALSEEQLQVIEAAARAAEEVLG